jgi:tetratricopeptide (TPR) repeat protein
MKIRCFVLVAAMLFAGGTSYADPARDAEAKEHYEAGTAAFNLGNWARAIDEYKAAYTLKPEAVLLYDIAQSYRLNNDLPNAIFFYKSYLRNQPNATNRREIDDRIRKLEQQMKQQQQVTSQPPNTPVPMGAQPPKEAAHEPAPPPPVAAPATPEPAPTHAVEPQPAPSPALQLTRSSATPTERTPVYKKWWLWTIVGGVVVVGVGVGLGIGLTANSAPSTHLGTTGVF